MGTKPKPIRPAPATPNRKRKSKSRNWKWKSRNRKWESKQSMESESRLLESVESPKWRLESPDYSNMQSQPRPNFNGNGNADDIGFLFQRIGQKIAKFCQITWVFGYDGSYFNGTQVSFGFRDFLFNLKKFWHSYGTFSNCWDFLGNSNWFRPNFDHSFGLLDHLEDLDLWQTFD